MSLYDIDIKELTDNVVISSDNEVSGSGIFDTLMVTVSKHIEAQYREGRILGTEYSTVYLGALQAVLELSTKMLLEKDLVAKQAEEIDSRIAVNNKQIEKLASDITNDTTRTANDTARTNAEVTLKASQKLLVDQQILTETQNTLQITAQTNLTEAQKDKVISDIAISESQSDKELLLKDKQIDKLTSDITNDTQRTTNDTTRTNADISLKETQESLIEKQTLTEVQNTLLVTAQKDKVLSDTAIAEEQSAKDLSLKEAQISKLASEETNDTQRTANDTSRTTADVSLKGSQKTLVDQQKLTEVQNTLLVTEQKNKIVSDVTVAEAQSGKDLLLKDAQIAKLTSDISVSEEQSAKDLLLKAGQISKISYEVSDILPAQKGLIDKQAEETNSKTTVNSKQTEKITSDIGISEAQSSKDLLIKDGQISKLTYEVATLLPTQKDLIVKQTEETDSKTAVNNAQTQKITSDVTIAEAQSAKDLLIKDGQIDKVNYEISNLLPSQNTLITAQTTSEGKKGNLIDYQRHGFKVDATHKYVKSLLDTWSIYYSISPGSENVLESIGKTKLDDTIGTLTNVINQFPPV